jgi:surface protein
MAIFSFVNRSSGSAYFVLETFNTGGFYDSNSLNGALGAYYNFTGSTQYSLVSSNYVMGYVVPPGSSSFEFNPTEYIQTGSVWFRGTGDFTVQIVGEVTSSVYGPDQISNKRLLNTIPLENVFEVTWDTTRTTISSSADNRIALPLIPDSNSLYNFVINWGDNTSSSISSSLQTETTHSYALSGTYTTKMWGTMRGWRFNGLGDRNKLQSVNKWGGLQFIPSGSLKIVAAFSGCTSASFSNVIGVPDLRYTDSLRSCFNFCRNLTTVNNLEQWDISRITSLVRVFNNCVNFDQNVGSWDVSNVTDMSFIFATPTATIDGIAFPANGVFNNGGSSDINNWNTRNVTTLLGSFGFQPFFNQPLGKWDVRNVTSLNTTFFACNRFDQDLGSWDVSNVTDMTAPFGGSVVSQSIGNAVVFNNGGSPSIGNWNTSKVTTMLQMFVNNKAFNQNVGSWDVSNVTNMSAMFGMYLTTASPWQILSGSFNNGGSPSIGNWNTSNVTIMTDVFGGQLAFNQDLSNWDVRKVTNFSRMFSIFNPTPTFTSSLFTFNNSGSSGINNWNTTASIDMREMFRYAGNFNQPIGNWRVSTVANFTNFMETKTFNDYSVANYDALLNGWASRPVVSGRSINFGTIKYSAAASASRAILTSAPNSWTIVDGGQV